jgi:hypothetical protein
MGIARIPSGLATGTGAAAAPTRRIAKIESELSLHAISVTAHGVGNKRFAT